MCGRAAEPALAARRCEPCRPMAETARTRNKPSARAVLIIRSIAYKVPRRIDSRRLQREAARLWRDIGNAISFLGRRGVWRVCGCCRPQASATHVKCGDVLTAETVLDSDVVCTEPGDRRARDRRRRLHAVARRPHDPGSRRGRRRQRRRRGRRHGALGRHGPGRDDHRVRGRRRPRRRRQRREGPDSRGGRRRHRHARRRQLPSTATRSTYDAPA